MSKHKLPVPNTLFEWQKAHEFDNCGLIYHLGSGGGTRAFKNPAIDDGCVRVHACAWKGKATDVLNIDAKATEQTNSWSQPVDQAWFQVPPTKYEALSYQCTRP